MISGNLKQTNCDKKNRSLFSINYILHSPEIVEMKTEMKKRLEEWMDNLTSYADIDSEELSSFLPLGYGLPSIVTTPLAHENPRYLQDVLRRWGEGGIREGRGKGGWGEQRGDRRGEGWGEDWGEVEGWGRMGSLVVTEGDTGRQVDVQKRWLDIWSVLISTT